ncbi:hypothetical protein, partial [Fibrobacter sp. UWH1]|uniref:hypothetical protein n=1 Tax=Fibrobacter sp. UWH1 TaxID=1964354 RepID=UPI001C3DB40E
KRRSIKNVFYNKVKNVRQGGELLHTVLWLRSKSLASEVVNLFPLTHTFFNHQHTSFLREMQMVSTEIDEKKGENHPKIYLSIKTT